MTKEVARGVKLVTKYQTDTQGKNIQKKCKFYKVIFLGYEILIFLKLFTSNFWHFCINYAN